jgi:hypothetical protein
LSDIERPIEFVDAPEARSLAEGQAFSRAELEARLSSFVVRSAVWEEMLTEAAGRDIPTLLFADVLGGTVEKSDILYTFSGRQPRSAHVDEIPEDLLHLRHHGMFNIHHVVEGEVTALSVYTRPGYYVQGAESREPETRFNQGIYEDLFRRKLINTYTTDTRVNEARLFTGDRFIFFERTSPTVDGPPNVIHLFHRGTELRYSETSRYYVAA